MALFDGMTQDEIGEVLAKYWNDNPGTFESGLREMYTSWIPEGVSVADIQTAMQPVNDLWNYNANNAAQISSDLADVDSLQGIQDYMETAPKVKGLFGDATMPQYLPAVTRANELDIPLVNQVGDNRYQVADLGMGADSDYLKYLESQGLLPNLGGTGWETHRSNDGYISVSPDEPDRSLFSDLFKSVVMGGVTTGLGAGLESLLGATLGTGVSEGVSATDILENSAREYFSSPDDVATQGELQEMRDEEFDDTIFDWDSWLRTIDTTWEDWDWTPPTTGTQGGGGSAASGGGGGTPGDDEVAKSEKEDRWVWDGSVLVNVETGETQSVPNPSGLEKGKVYNQDAEPYADGEDDEGLVLGQTGWFPSPSGSGSGTGTGTGSGSGSGSSTGSTSGSTGGTSDDGLVTGQQSWEGGSGGGTGGGTGSGGGDGEGYGPGTPSTGVGSGMFGGGEDEWEDYMSGIHTSFPLLRRRNISPAQYLDALIARINS